MKLVYTHENVTMVTHFMNVLQQAGIATVIKNQFSAGGAGDLAMGDVWPELWVLDERQFPEAEDVVARIQGAVESELIGPDWRCSGCGQANASNFEVCWQCQSERPAPANGSST